MRLTDAEWDRAKHLWSEHCEPDEDDVKDEYDVEVPWWLALGLGVVIVAALYWMAGWLGPLVE